MSGVLVRALAQDDKAAWLRLWQGYLEFYQTALPPDVIELTWARLNNPAEPMFAALAIVDGEAVGLVHCILHRSCWTSGDYCYLQDLFTASHCRGRGVASALIEHVYATAEAQGCSRVHWLTKEDNATARALYDKLAQRSGFIQYRKILGT